MISIVAFLGNSSFESFQFLETFQVEGNLFIYLFFLGVKLVGGVSLAMVGHEEVVSGYCWLELPLLVLTVIVVVHGD